MSNTVERKEKSLSRKELAWYIAAGILLVWGLTFIVIGLIGDYYPALYSDNWVRTSENAWLTNWSNMGYFWWGMILAGVGVLMAVIVLTVSAREGEKDAERALRRAQRLAIEQEPVEEKKDDDLQPVFIPESEASTEEK